MGQWRILKPQFATYRVAKKFDDMPEEETIANILLLMGSECVLIYQQFAFGNQANDQKALTNTIAMFGRYFELVKNLNL